MNRTEAPYAPSNDWWNGVQTAYTAGLSYFPDMAYAPMPMGDMTSDLAAIGGGAIAGPAGAAATGLAASVIGHWFGGSAVDQQRQARVNYVAQAAVNNNVGAMQLILGGPSNVSGNEQQMWQTAYTLVKQVNPGVVAAAEAAGPVWLTNSGDTATNYPRMRAFIQAWASQNPVAAVTGSITGAISSFFNPAPPTVTPGVTTPVTMGRSGISPVLLIGGLAVAAVVLSRRRRR